MNKENILKINHSTQFNWIQNQLDKPLINAASPFFDIKNAQRAFDKLRSNSLVIDESDIEHFVSIHLNKIGVKRLITTLRVHRHREETDSRESSKRLQTEITGKNHLKLAKLVLISGQSKKDVINKLIEEADSDCFSK